MTESKIVATERLRREGRWAEASLWRDEKRKQLRADGQTKANANEASWQAMIEEFPPLAMEEDVSSEQPGTVELIDLGNYDSQPDMSRDILWVYENLVMKGVTAEDAPCLGAWAQLQWARQDKNRFFEQVLPKAMDSIEKKTKEDSAPVKGERLITDIEKMVADCQLQWERDAVAHMPDTIRETVSARIKDWERRFRLDLAPEARESWTLKMLKIVDQAITAMTKHHADSQAV